MIKINSDEILGLQTLLRDRETERQRDRETEREREREREREIDKSLDYKF